MNNVTGFYALGCFGKLPIHSDFIRYQASGEEIRSLDRWFQEGIHFAKSQLGQKWAETFLNSASWNFVFHSPLSKAFLVGVAMPSRDRGGRTYPFFIFLRINKKAYGGPLAFAALSFSRFLKEAQAFAKDGWTGSDLKNVLKHLEQMTFPPPDNVEVVKSRYLRQLQTRSSQQFWTDLFGDFSDPRKYQVDQNLGDLLNPMKDYPSSKFRLGINFPIFSHNLLVDENEGLDISYWFDRIFRSLKKEDEPILFWSRDSSTGCPSMLAFLSPPTQKQFLSLITPGLRHDAWFNLVSDDVSDSVKAASAMREDRKHLLDDASLSMATFLAS